MNCEKLFVTSSKKLGERMSKLEKLITDYCPHGVEYISLSELADIGTGSSNTNEELKDGKYPFFVRSQEVRTKNEYEFDEEAIITSGDGVGVGKIFHYVNGKYALHQRAYRIHFRDNRIIPKFFLYYMKSTFYQYITKSAVSSSVTSVRRPMMKKYPVPVPPLPVQREIVRILDNFTEFTERLTVELTAELTVRKKQYEYYRNNLFTQANNIRIVTLDMISENCDAQRRPVTSGSRQAGNIPYYGASGIVDYVKDYIYDGDYLLISEDGANLLTRTVPIAFSVSGKTWVNNHAHVLKFDDYATRRYVEMYLNSIDLSSYITGAAQPKLNQKNLNKIQIPLPPLAEQQRIVDILDRFDTLYNDISTGLSAEIEARQKQYEYYRDKLLTFKELS